MIVITAQAFPPRTGGIQNLLAGTAEYIARAGHEVLVLADGGDDAKAFDKTSGAPYEVERFSGLKPLRRRAKMRRLNGLMKSGNVEAIYADTWKSIELMGDSKPCPVVTWAHGNEFPKAETKAPRIQKAMGKANHIIFNSRETQDRATAFTPSAVPNTIVNPPIFDPVEPSDEDHARAAEIWGGCGPKLFSTCRLIDWKGLDNAIQSLSAVLDKYPEARYAIAGIGDDRERLESIAQQAGVAERVTFLGWIEDGLKTALLRSADLFLQPGRQVVEEREGYGITYVEAALQGLPTICGDAGGAPEAIIHGETGLSVDATQTRNVENAILSILNDETRHQAMRDASRRHGEACRWRNQVGRVLQAAGLTGQPL